MLHLSLVKLLPIIWVQIQLTILQGTEPVGHCQWTDKKIAYIAWQGWPSMGSNSGRGTTFPMEN